MTTTHYVALGLLAIWLFLFFMVSKRKRGILNAICAAIFVSIVAYLTLSGLS